MNPFLDILKADVLSPDQATKLFVPEASPIWEQIQRPINQIVIGPRGAGKTIALKQLDHKLNPPSGRVPFVGTYLQISRICTIFGSVFDHARTSQDRSLSVTFMRIFGDYVWLEIARELIDFLTSSGCELSHTDIQAVFGFEADSIQQAGSRRADLSEQIEQAIQEWSINPDGVPWTPTFNVPESLHRCAAALRQHVPLLDNDRPCVYLLLDESSPIPVECQAVLNGLLHRGRPYCVKLAIRPFEWTTLATTTGRNIELDTDVWPLQVRYPLNEAYLTQMAQVLARVLASDMPEREFSDPISALNGIFPSEASFPYSGYASIARASSANPQNILQICSYIFGAAALNPATGFSPQLQDRVLRAWSQDYEDRNPYLDSRLFCRALLQRVRKEHVQALGFRVVEQEQDLFSRDYVPPPVGRLIQSGFSGGFLRPYDPEKARSLFEIPASFTLSPGLLPNAGLPLDLPDQPLTEVDAKFIRDNVRERPRRPREPERPRELKAFLSTSFSTAISQQRADIKECMGRLSVRCEDVEDQLDAQFLFSAIVQKIRASDFVILDATVLRPYTMLEIGICAGVPRRPKDVVCVVNEENAQALGDLPSFVQTLPIIPFSFDSDRLDEAAATIVSRAQALLLQKSEFSQVAITRASLRPPRRQNTVYVSLPQSSIRDRAIAELRRELEPAGWNLLSEEDGESYCANDLQVSAYCAHLARIGVVDTTGEGDGDLLQCYRLGLFVGKSAPWRVLHTRRASEDERLADPFVSVPDLSMTRWQTIDELKRHVLDFLGVPIP